MPKEEQLWKKQAKTRKMERKTIWLKKLRKAEYELNLNVKLIISKKTNNIKILLRIFKK